MRIRILTPLAGASFSLAAGDEIDATEGNATRLIAAGFAELIPALDSLEVATSPDETNVEHATVKQTLKPRPAKPK
jgi:hypothetical protein